MIKLDAIQPLDDRFIDRIVDGTLTPAELRGAIDLLEREPDGWKRCAMAFLEAQSWRESFRAFPEQARSALASRSLALPLSARAGNRGRRWIRGPLAAGIVAASFAMGWMGHAARPWHRAELNAMAQSRTNRNPPVNGSQSEAAKDTAVGSPRAQPPRRRAEPASSHHCHQRTTSSGRWATCGSTRAAPGLMCRSWLARESTNNGSETNRRR